MLTAKEEKFVQGLITGLSQRQAYKSAYNTSRMKEKTIDEKACRMLKTDKISARYKELMKESENKAIITKDELLSKAVLALNKALGLEKSEIAVSVLGEITECTARKFNANAVSFLIEKIAKLQGYNEEKETGNNQVIIVDNIKEVEENENN